MLCRQAEEWRLAALSERGAAWSSLKNPCFDVALLAAEGSRGTKAQ